MINTPSISAFKNRLDHYWTELGYGHNERPIRPSNLQLIFVDCKLYCPLDNTNANNNNKALNLWTDIGSLNYCYYYRSLSPTIGHFIILPGIKC